MCAACCQGQGGIYFSPEQAAQAAALLGLPAEEFTARYTRPAHGLLGLGTGDDGRCLLHAPGQGCLVHEKKPWACRSWPFFHGPLSSPEGFLAVKNFCPGIHPQATWEDFKAFHARYIGVDPPPSHLEALAARAAQGEAGQGPEKIINNREGDS